MMYLQIGSVYGLYWFISVYQERFSERVVLVYKCTSIYVHCTGCTGSCMYLQIGSVYGMYWFMYVPPDRFRVRVVLDGVDVVEAVKTVAGLQLLLICVYLT